jgi:diketogulonate reductase-like aldo/keto reductase
VIHEPPDDLNTQAGDMTPTAGIPTLALSDDHTIPVVGISVAESPPEQAEAAVAAALAAGYRLIDTGSTASSAEAVGRAIAGSSIPRGEIYVTATLPGSDQGFQSAQDACRTALSRLGLDYVDLFLVDWPVEQDGKYVDAWAGLLKSHEVGDARSIGVANFNTEQLTDVTDLSFTTPTVNQIELHPLLNQAALRAFHAERSITTIAVIPSAQARISAHPVISSAADAHGKSAEQVLIRWGIQLGSVVVHSASDPDRIAANIDVFDFELSPAEMEAISALDDGSRFRPDPNA